MSEDNAPMIETVRFEADESAFKKTVEGMTAFMQDFGKKVAAVGAVVGGIGGTIEAAMAKAAHSLANYSASQTKLAADNKISVQELQAMQFQASQTGESLSDMFKSGAGASAAFRSEAERLGLILGGDAVEAGLKLSRALSTVAEQTKMLWMNIGAHVAPALTDFARLSSGVLSIAIDWVQANGPLIATIGEIAGAAVAVGGALTGAGAAMAAMGAAVGWLVPLVTTAGGAMVTFLVSPMGMIAAGAAAGVGALLYFSGAARDMASGWAVDLGGMLNTAVATLKEIAGFFMTTFNGVKAALTAGDLGMASTIAWSAVKVAWYTGASEVVGGVASILGGDWLTNSIDAIGNAWVMILDGFDQAMVGLENGLDSLWVMIQNGFETAATEAKIVWLNTFWEIEKAFYKAKEWVNPLYDATQDIKDVNAQQSTRTNTMRKVADEVNSERSIELSDRTAARTADANAARSGNAASGAALSATLGGYPEAARAAASEMADGMRTALEEATNQWRDGIAASGNLTRPDLPGATANPDAAAKPSEVQRSVTTTFGGQALGMLGGAATALATRQLSATEQVRDGINTLVEVAKRPRNDGGFWGA